MHLETNDYLRSLFHTCRTQDQLYALPQATCAILDTVSTMLQFCTDYFAVHHTLHQVMSVNISDRQHQYLD